MARGGRRPGAGRKPGVPNKVTSDVRLVLKAIVEKRLGDLDAMIEDTWRGIEIEKTMPDGTTVVGRLNADPGRAAKLVLEAASYIVPKVLEHQGADGGPITVVIQKVTEGG